jgi:hypothetical protein
LAHDDLCRLKENSLAFSDWQIESTHNPKYQFIGVKIQSLSSGRREGCAFEGKMVGINSCMNDMNLIGREDAGGAVMSLCHRRGWVIVSTQKDLGDKRGNRNDRIGRIEEIFFTYAGAWAFCEVT